MSKDPNVKTTNDRFIVTTVSSKACEPAAEKRWSCSPSLSSSACRRRYTTNSRIIALNGTIHSACFLYSLYRCNRRQSRFIFRLQLRKAHPIGTNQHAEGGRCAHC